jgi:hypothetical protein
MTFLSENNYLKAKWRIFVHRDFFLQKLFFPLFSTKNWEFVQFHYGQIFCSVRFHLYRPFSRESTGRELSKSINACVGAQLRLDSVLKPKNTENSTKMLQILEHQKKLSNFTIDKFFPLWLNKSEIRH